MRCLAFAYQGGVRALGVLKPDPIVDDPFCLEAVDNFIQVNGLLFQVPPKAFDIDVIQIAAATVC